MSAYPRILVLSASVGAGHLRAAQAVELALRETYPDATVRNIDVLDLTNSAFRRIYGKSYLELVNRAPHLLGHLYDMLDQPSRSGKNRGDRIRLALEKLNLRKFLRLLRDEPWDLAINTHFLPAEIIASLRKKGEIDLPQVTVTTDFETHRLWVNQPCDHYFTATDEGALYLQHFGIPAGDITTTGIPIHPNFLRRPDRATCLAKHGLAGDRPIVLQLAGGFGVGPIENLYRAVLDVQQPVQVVAVAGKNEELKHKLAEIAVPDRHRAKVMGFTSEIDELMAVADIVVSKPGGLTTSEVLARGSAMAIVNPIPGQETRNADYLLESGAAIKANQPCTLTSKLTHLLKNPERLAAMKANAARIGKPNAAFDVAAKAMQFARAATNRIIPQGHPGS